MHLDYRGLCATPCPFSYSLGFQLQLNSNVGMLWHLRVLASFTVRASSTVACSSLHNDNHGVSQRIEITTDEAQGRLTIVSCARIESGHP